MSAIAARRARLAAAAEASITSSSSAENKAERSLALNDLNLNQSKQGKLIDVSGTSSGDDIVGTRQGKRRRGVEISSGDVTTNESIDSDLDSNAPKLSDDNLTASLIRPGTYEFILKGKGKNAYFNASESTRDTVICALRPGETMHIIGTGIVKVLDGKINLGGAIFTSEHREAVIIAPVSSPLPVIMASDEVVHSTDWRTFEFDQDAKYGAIVELVEDRSSGVGELHSICNQIPSNSFLAAPHCHTCWPLQNFGPQVSINKSIIHSTIPQTWQKGLLLSEKIIANHMENGKIFLIRGPKRVGKSTLSRIMLQRLLSVHHGPVAYLETDLGQSEFGLPGTISLHIFNPSWRAEQTSAPVIFAPSWASIRQPFRAHFIGDTTPKNDPSAYMKAVQNLVETYRQLLQSEGIPLIVNTQGWVKGLGAQLLVELEGVICPSLILDVSEDCDTSMDIVSDSIPDILHVQASPAIYTRERGLNAVEMRSLNLISYFYAQSLPSSLEISNNRLQKRQVVDQPVWDTSKTLLEKCPYSINVDRGLRGGIHIIDHACSVSEKYALMALNGSCVAINISCNGNRITGNGVTSSSIWLKSLRESVQHPSNSTCIGLGIVRSLDLNSGILHLITPLSSSFVLSATEMLQNIGLDPSNQKLSISKGSVDIPVCLSLDKSSLQSLSNPNGDALLPRTVAGVPFRNVPYLEFDTTNTDADIVIDMKKRRIRRNLLRPSQRGQ